MLTNVIACYSHRNLDICVCMYNFVPVDVLSRAQAADSDGECTGEPVAHKASVCQLRLRMQMKVVNVSHTLHVEERTRGIEG
jgi:hypothetical protein